MRAGQGLRTLAGSLPLGNMPMLDVVFLALGLGLFVLMGLYARWAANA